METKQKNGEPDTIVAYEAETAQDMESIQRNKSCSRGRQKKNTREKGFPHSEEGRRLDRMGRDKKTG